MSVPDAHVLCGIDVDGTVLGGIIEQSIRTESELRATGASGEVYSRQQHLVGQSPGATFTTVNPVVWLDLLTGIGPSRDIGPLTNGISLFAQKLADGGARAGAGSHKKYQFVDGMALPRILSCEHQGDVALSGAIVAKWDGSNDPIIIAENQNLPTILDAARFSIGAVTLEDLTITGITNFELNFGIQERLLGSGSDIWPSHVSILTIKPVLTLRGIAVGWFHADVIPLTGKAISHANTAIHLRKRDEGGTWVADETAEHIKLTMAGRAIIDEPMNASGDGDAEISLRVEGDYDGENTPVVIDTSAAIT